MKVCAARDRWSKDLSTRARKYYGTTLTDTFDFYRNVTLTYVAAVWGWCNLCGIPLRIDENSAVYSLPC